MSSILMLVLVFIATTCATAAIVSLVFEGVIRPRWLTSQRLAERFQPAREARTRRSPLFRDLNTLHVQTRQDHVGLRQRCEVMLEQSGLKITLKQVLILTAVLGIAAALLMLMISPLRILAVLAGVLAAALPLMFVIWKRRVRIQKLCQQLPEAFEQLKRAVKAGHTMVGAMKVVATDMPAPIGGEFGICCKQQELGLSLQVTLHELARRTGLMELQIFAVALVVQNESGGNCLELLGNLSKMVRNRLHLASRIKSLTGEGRMQAIVLTLLPLVALASIMLLDPEYAQPLLARPNLLLGIAGAQVLGMVWIRKIISIEY